MSIYNYVNEIGRVVVENTETYIVNKLDGSDYERGELETLHATLKNSITLLAGLINILQEKNILSNKDITDITKDIY